MRPPYATGMRPSTYRKLLALIPDHIVLAVASRPISTISPYRCILAWTVRELAAERLGLPDAEQLSRYDDRVYEALGVDRSGLPGTAGMLAATLGGDETQWGTMFDNAEWDPAIEAEFLARVAEAAERTRVPRRRKVAA